MKKQKHARHKRIKHYYWTKNVFKFQIVLLKNLLRDEFHFYIYIVLTSLYSFKNHDQWKECAIIDYKPRFRWLHKIGDWLESRLVTQIH